MLIFSPCGLAAWTRSNEVNWAMFQGSSAGVFDTTAIPSSVGAAAAAGAAVTGTAVAAGASAAGIAVAAGTAVGAAAAGAWVAGAAEQADSISSATTAITTMGVFK